jgi:hypothetical protein
MVLGIERRQAPASMPGEGGTCGQARGRSEGGHLEGQRIGAYDRARGARLTYGGSRLRMDRGPLRVVVGPTDRMGEVNEHPSKEESACRTN